MAAAVDLAFLVEGWPPVEALRPAAGNHEKGIQQVSHQMREGISVGGRKRDHRASFDPRPIPGVDIASKQDVFRPSTCGVTKPPEEEDEAPLHLLTKDYATWFQG